MSQTVVTGFTLSGLDLETGLDDIARSGQVRGGHTGNGTSGQELQDTELVGGGFAKEILLQVGVGWEVNGGEGHITEQTSGSALVQTDETQVANNPHGRSLRGTTSRLGNLTLDLETNLDDFERVGEDLEFLSDESPNFNKIEKTYDLATTSGGTSDSLAPDGDVAILVSQVLTSQIVDGKLDGLFGSDTDELGQDTRVQTAETLILDNLLETIDGVLVQSLTGHSTSLVLESGLYEINGVNHEGTKGTSHATKTEVISGFESPSDERAGR